MIDIVRYFGGHCGRVSLVGGEYHECISEVSSVALGRTVDDGLFWVVFSEEWRLLKPDIWLDWEALSWKLK